MGQDWIVLLAVLSEGQWHASHTHTVIGVWTCVVEWHTWVMSSVVMSSHRLLSHCFCLQCNQPILQHRSLTALRNRIPSSI